MSYSLQTAIAPRKRMSGVSRATPKTHTPGPRLQQRGFRYYSPELGRWLSRDPIGERGSPGLYLALANGLICHIDALGLSPWWVGAFCALPGNRPCCTEAAISWRMTLSKMRAEFAPHEMDDNIVVNAVKHCLWMCHTANLLCCSRLQAWAIGWSHEQEAATPARAHERAMDLRNNFVGVNIDVGGMSYSARLQNCFIKCKAKANAYQLYWFTPSSVVFPGLPAPGLFPAFTVDRNGVKNGGTYSASITPPVF